MGLMNLFGRKGAPSETVRVMPYMIKTQFVPYKLKARQRSSSTLMINLKNLSKTPVMGSVSVQLPKQLGFDNVGMSKVKDVKLGEIAANEEKEAKIEIFSDVGTDAGEYTINLTAYVHYRDYELVENSMTKRAVIEVV